MQKKLRDVDPATKLRTLELPGIATDLGVWDSAQGFYADQAREKLEKMVKNARIKAKGGTIEGSTYDNPQVTTAAVLSSFSSSLSIRDVITAAPPS